MSQIGLELNQVVHVCACINFKVPLWNLKSVREICNLPSHATWEHGTAHGDTAGPGHVNMLVLPVARV